MRKIGALISGRKTLAAVALLFPIALWHSLALAPVLLADGGRPGADPDPERFAARVTAFEIWDRKNSFPRDPILFVGSSSIGGWSTASAFPGKPIINRGLGGSQVSDINYHYRRLVKPYRPALIVLYAGENDIKRGKSPARVLADVQAFAERVRADSPETRMLFISIKPSVARWQHWPRMAEANALIRAYLAAQPNMTYLDLASPLLDASGQPKDLYAEDGLHLNDDGYQLWVEALRPHLDGAMTAESRASGPDAPNDIVAALKADQLLDAAHEIVESIH